jgi:demethylmenaquinone methyltransferase/2-methoxy-6-polyprenyl-1,4-benzoquinol methylase
MDRVERLIQEQIDYYRHRAAEYDETSRPPGDPLARYGEELTRALDRFRPVGEVLEIASGTGAWTSRLLRHASHVTALDASLEMHQQAAVKLGEDPRVRLVEADVFSWKPDGVYDVVFFANWLSHVPPARFQAFWTTVRDALRPQVGCSSSTRIAMRGDTTTSARTSPGKQVRRSPIARCGTVATTAW